MVRAYKIIMVLAVLASCTSCGQSEQGYAPVIEASDSAKPVIKLALTYRQKNNVRKAGGISASGLFIILDGKVATVPVACDYTVEGDTLFYSPQLPLGYGMEFEIQAYNGKDTLRKRYTTPTYASGYARPAVKMMYPLADTIPSNILMFHVEFETPMNEDIMAFKKVELLDENGTPKSKVWREKSNWDMDGRQLVLMIHPGRIKRGIDLMAEDGPLFEDGKKYTLVITQKITDRYNQPLEKEYRKTFFIAKADREIPQLLTQQILLPKAGTKEPLVFSFSDKMDFGTMHLGFSVKSEKGEKCAGNLSPISDYTWQFTPSTPWENTAYTLQLNDYATDLASNHFNRRFEETNLEEMRKRGSVEFGFKPR